MPWLVCWVVSDLLRQEWLKGWKGNIQKWKESVEQSFAELAPTRSHGWRDRVPSTNQQRRGRMTDATVRLKQNAHDAVAWLTRPCGKEMLRMTRPRDPRGRVTEAMHQKLQKTLIANSEALFGPNLSPEGIDQRLQSEGMHPFRESQHFFSYFP